jgi:glycerol-3-phosphate dehydrogenase
MTIYDRLAGKLGLKPSESLSREETLKRIPTLEATGLQGGVSYYDGQFDDSRLAVNLAQTIIDLGGAAANYLGVVSLSAPVAHSRIRRARKAIRSSPVPALTIRSNSYRCTSTS